MQGNQDIKIAILDKIIQLDGSKGHLKWKVSDLARVTKVSRPLIYYHFGKTKQQILQTSVEVIANEYFGLGDDRIAMLKTGKAWESLILSRDFFLKNPSFVAFYFRWRTTSGPLQDKLIEIEKRYQAMLKRTFPELSAPKILALHGINQAVVTSSFLTAQSLGEIQKVLGNLWRK